MMTGGGRSCRVGQNRKPMKNTPDSSDRVRHVLGHGVFDLTLEDMIAPRRNPSIGPVVIDRKCQLLLQSLVEA
jgi:hypothetical protein